MSSKLFFSLVFILQVFGSGFADTNSTQIGRSIQDPADSCSQIRDAAGETVQNGYYYFKTNSGDVQQMYCNMVDERCGQKGWMRVANIDANTFVCPENFTLTFIHGIVGVCRGEIATSRARRGRRYVTTFPVNVPFTRVTAFVEGYQFGSPDAFSRRHTYGMDGVTFYYGNPQPNTLLWAYAVGVADAKDNSSCPCSTVSGDQPRGRYNNDYHYCDTANPGNSSQRIWYRRRPLWTGSGCPDTSSCCDPPDLPYFCRSNLTDTWTTDRFTVTVRLSDDDEDIAIRRLKIYIA